MHKNKVAPQPDQQKLPNKFFKRVEIRDSCWIWTGHVQPQEQIPLLWHEQKYHSARKIALILKGEQPPGRIFTLCGNQLCVNPDHLGERPKKVYKKRDPRITKAELREILSMLNSAEYTIDEIADRFDITPRLLNHILGGFVCARLYRAIMNEKSYCPRLPGYYTSGEALVKTGWTHRQLAAIADTENWQIFHAGHKNLYKAEDIDHYLDNQKVVTGRSLIFVSHFQNWHKIGA